MKLSGIFAALPTPFDWQGNLYPVKVHHNVARLNRVVGLSGYVIGGRAGEAAELTREDKLDVFRLAKEASAEGRILIAGVGAESLRESVKLAAAAKELGYQAVLADPQGRLATALYFRALADECPLPLVVSASDVATAIAASQHPNVVAVVGDVNELKKAIRPEVAVLSASALRLAAELEAGAAGAVLAYAAAVPYPNITIWEATRQREYAAAGEWQQRIAESVSLTEASAAALKHAMDVNGYYGGPPRLPLEPVSASVKARIEAALDGLVQRS